MLKNIYKPHSLIIDLTTNCNQKCFFCWRINRPEYLNEVLKDTNKTIDFDIYKSIIDDACKINSIKWLSLCGPMGEPLLANNFLQFPQYAMNKKHFNTILINTNGFALNRYEPYEILSSLTDIQVSVDTINPDTYEKIHGFGKQLPIVLENIKSLLDCKNKYSELKTNIRVRFTENEYNKNEWNEFEKYFNSINCEILHVKIHSFNGINPERNNEIGAYLCNQPYYVVNFNYKGEMTTCCTNFELSPVFGNIKENKLISLFNSKKFNKWRINRMKGICSNCGGLGSITQRHDNYLSEDEYFRYSLLKKSPNFIKNIIGAKLQDIYLNNFAWWIPIRKWRDNFRNKFFDKFIGGGVNNGFKFLYPLNFRLNLNY